MEYQPSLFGDKPPQQMWDEFAASNPEVVAEMEAIAQRMQARVGRVSAKFCFEYWRYLGKARMREKPDGSGEWKLNNNMTCAFADHLAEKYPDMKIERRKRRS